jgi:hypothetical protein
MGKLRKDLRPKAAELRSADGREPALSLSKGRPSPHHHLSCRELIRQFESDLIQEDSFHHADHVRLAFAYLSEYPPLKALEKFATALKRFAAARGKSQRYHETITYAYFFLIRERMARFADRLSSNDWDEFARGNPDLLVWKDGILSRYYRKTTLQSNLARSVFLLPDKVR